MKLYTCFKTAPMTTFPKNPYFWSKSTELDVSLTLFTVDPSLPQTWYFAKRCLIGAGGGGEACLKFGAASSFGFGDILEFRFGEIFRFPSTGPVFTYWLVVVIMKRQTIQMFGGGEEGVTATHPEP